MRALLPCSSAAACLLFFGAHLWPDPDHRSFLAWDDTANFVDNDLLHGLPDLAKFRRMWSSSILGVYEPLATTLKAIIVTLAGFFHVGGGGGGGGYDSDRPRAAIFLRANTVLHAINTLLVAYLAERVLRALDSSGGGTGTAVAAGSRRAACCALSAFVWSIHPLRVEVVAWASGQPYLWATMFALLCGLVHVSSLGSRRLPLPTRLPRILLVAVLYLASVLSKSAAIPVAGILLLWDLLVAGANSGRGATGISGLLHVFNLAAAAAAAASALAFNAAAMATGARRRTDNNDNSTAADPPLTGLEGFAATVARASLAVAWYPRKTLAPTDLSIIYPVPPAREELLASPWVWGTAAAVAGISLASLIVLMQAYFTSSSKMGTSTSTSCYRGLALAWMFHGIAVSPVLGLVGQHGDPPSLAFDRYSYLPSSLILVPLFAAWMAAVPDRDSQGPKEQRLPQNEQHQNQEQNQEERHVSPPASMTLPSWRILVVMTIIVPALLACCGDHLGQWTNSESLWKMAVKTNPTLSQSHLGLGQVYAKVGRTDEAIASLRRAVDSDFQSGSDAVTALVDLGDIYRKQRKAKQALRMFESALALMPTLAEAHVGKGLLVWNQHGNLELAATHMEAALEHEPGFVAAAMNLASLRAQLGDFEAAKAAVLSAARLKPTVAGLHEMWGDVRRMELGSSSSSSSSSTNSPSSSGIRDGGGGGDVAAAYERALGIDESNAAAARKLARLLGSQQRHQEAIAVLENTIAVRRRRGIENVAEQNTVRLLDQLRRQGGGDSTPP